jgi:hypothetical protein
MLSIEVRAKRVDPLTTVLFVGNRTVPRIPRIPECLFSGPERFGLDPCRRINHRNRDAALIGPHSHGQIAAVVFTTTSA